MMPKLIIALVSLITFQKAIGQSADARLIISKYFEAKGGKQRWMNLASISKEFTHVKYAGLFRSDTLYHATFLVKPNKFKQITREGSKVSMLVLNGDILWSQYNGNSSLIPEEHIAFFRSSMAIVGIEELFLDSTASILFLGEKDFQRKKYNVLRAKRNDWLYYHNYYFDIETNLLHCSEANVNGLVTYFKDYQWTDGLLFAYSEEIYDRSKKLISMTFYKNIRPNVSLSEDLFKYPE